MPAAKNELFNPHENIAAFQDRLPARFSTWDAILQPAAGRSNEANGNFTRNRCMDYLSAAD